MDKRYPGGLSWDQFQQEFTERSCPQSRKDEKIKEFFILEKKNMSDQSMRRGYRGRGASWGTVSSKGLVRPQLPAVTRRVFLPSVICVESDILGSVRDTVQGVSTMARKAISLRSVLS